MQVNNSNVTDYRQFLLDKKNEVYQKLKNGDTEISYQTGAQSFTQKEWDKLLAEFDDAQEEVRKLMREEQEKKAEERMKNDHLEMYQTMASRYVHSSEVVYDNYESANYKVVADNENGCFNIYVKGEKAGAFFYSDIKIRKDELTGTEVLLSTHGTGAGMYNVLPMNEELKMVLEEAMGGKGLEVETLTGYSIKTHSGTGIRYVMKDGDEGRGGKVLLRSEVDVAKYSALAEEYFNRYPNLVTSQEFGRIYASFEICGMAERTENGIVTIGYDNVSYNDNKDSKNNWSVKLTGNTWELLYEWLEKHKDQMKKIQEFQTWDDAFKEIGGSYERIWSDEEMKQGYLNN